METEKLNLFIVDDNELMLATLLIFLDNKFGHSLNISTFTSGKSALKMVDKNTSIVILDYHLDGENGNVILKTIKKKNPKTEVILLSSNDNVVVAIEAFRKGAKDYIIKGDNSLRKISALVYSAITYPIRLLVNEFGVNKFCAIFLLTFALMGVIVAFTLRFFN